MAATAAGGWVV